MSDQAVETSPSTPALRRHDLDALRGWAMLLGIVLHVSLSFFPTSWWVQDPQQNQLFGLLFLAIHGFRMPLFFLLSGYFTMLIYRRKGLPALIRQRALRILLPCLVGLFTIIPALHAVGAWAAARAPRPSSAELPPLFAAIRKGDVSGVQAQLSTGADVTQPDPVFQIRPLHWAALVGNTDIVNGLADAGAPLDQGDGRGNVPVNAAAFAGHAEVVQLLLSRGANPNAVNQDGRLPMDVLDVPFATTSGILEFLGLPRPEEERLSEGRRRVRAVLEPVTNRSSEVRGDTREEGWLDRLARDYTREIRSKRFEITWRGQPFHLVTTGVFDHLWFLWFLTWMVAGFAIAVSVSIIGVSPGSGEGGDQATGNRLLLAAMAATTLPQVLMGVDGPVLGPDTATGWLLPPHLLVYYGLFFTVGCWMQGAESTMQSWTRPWKWWLTAALVIVFPAALMTLGSRPWSVVLQPLYAWLMSLGCLGLFARFQSRPSPRMRYLSDSSYWLYVVHLPVVVGLQSLATDWGGGAVIKFGLILLIAIPLMLASYHWLVRPTALGWLLNGRIERRPGQVRSL